MARDSDVFVGYDPRTIQRGKNRRRKLFLKEEHRGVHMEVIGSSGSGKTYFLEHLIRQDIEAGRGVCVLDPGGDLYNRLVNFCHVGQPHARMKDRLILINPHDQDWSVGLNYLEFDPARTSLNTHMEVVTRGIAKVYDDEDQEEKPQLTRWLQNVIYALIAARLTLEDAQLFLTNPEVRERILARIQDPYASSEWHLFEQAPKRDQVEWLTPVGNRLARFYKSETSRRMLGQDDTRINFRKAMDEGAVILVNLAEGGKLSAREARLLGVLLIDKLSDAARSRVDIPENKRRRMYFYIDEFHKYLCDDVALGLKELRKYGLSFVLSTQELLPLRERYVELYSAVQSNTAIKVAFAMQPEDADLMYRALFPDYLADDETKRVIQRTFFKPVLGRAQVYGTAITESRSHSSGSGTSEGSGQADASGRSSALSSPVSAPLLGTAGISTTGDSFTYGSSSFSGSSSMDVDSEGIARSKSEADVPFYYQEEAQETSSIEDYSPEEKKQKLISQIVSQKDRHALVKVRGQDNDAWPIYTADMPMVQNVLPSQLTNTIEKAYERHALPASRVDHLIQVRRGHLLGVPVSEADVHELGERCYNTPDDNFSYDDDYTPPSK